MATYLYCLLPAASEPPPREITGVAGEPVRRVAAESVAAWVGTVSAAALERTVDAARRHDAVVRAAMAHGSTPLPARWGQLFDDDGMCASELARRERSLIPLLERVQGCVEMKVHAPLRPEGSEQPLSPGDPPVGPGRAYLRRIRARLDVEHKVQAEAAAARERISEAVAGLARAESFGVETARGRQLVLAHLIARADIARYRTAVESLEGPGAARSLRVSGPYPPYSFTESERGVER